MAAENSAKSERVNELLLGGTAGGGGFRPLMLLSRDEPRILTPLGGNAGGSLEGGISGLFPFILCGKMGELVANCEGLTDLVLSVPVLLLMILLFRSPPPLDPFCEGGLFGSKSVRSFPSCISSWLLWTAKSFIRDSNLSLCSRSILASCRISASEVMGGTTPFPPFPA